MAFKMVIQGLSYPIMPLAYSNVWRQRLSIIIVTTSFQTQSWPAHANLLIWHSEEVYCWIYLVLQTRIHTLHMLGARSAKRMHSSLYPENSTQTGGGSWLCHLMNAVQSFRARSSLPWKLILQTHRSL